jgi:hypothetical protein
VIYRISIILTIVYHPLQTGVKSRNRNDRTDAKRGHIKKAVVHSNHAANNGPNSDGVT